MDQQQCNAQMNRLAAAYRLDISTATRAAYFLAFQKSPYDKFAAACERAIEHEKAFPSIAALKEIIKHRHETARPDAPPSLPQMAGTVQCRTCWDAGFVRKDVESKHPDFNKRYPCPHCDGATKLRNHGYEGTAFAERDQVERLKFAPYREKQAAERRYAPVMEPMVSTPPPPSFVNEMRERAAYVPVPTCVTPFVIVPKKFMGRAGFVAQWANKAERAVRGDACDWRESREGVRAAMVARFADVQEVKA